MLDADQVFYRLFNQYQVKMFSAKPIEHACSCSSERTARALVAIGRDEVMDIVQEQGKVEINCEFCGKEYLFKPDELDLLFEPRSGDAVH